MDNGKLLVFLKRAEFMAQTNQYGESHKIKKNCVNLCLLVRDVTKIYHLMNIINTNQILNFEYFLTHD